MADPYAAGKNRALRVVKGGGDQHAVVDVLYAHHHGRAAAVIYDSLLAVFDLLDETTWSGVTSGARVFLSTALEECSQLLDDTRRHDEALRVLTASALPDLLAACDSRLTKVALALRDLTEGLSVRSINAQVVDDR